jgi:hypothetical protein
MLLAGCMIGVVFDGAVRSTHREAGPDELIPLRVSLLIYPFPALGLGTC